MRTSTNPRTKSFKICMAPETKNRLSLYAGEQHKSVSQLIISRLEHTRKMSQ